MNQKQTVEYLKSLNFGLKDRSTTETKYKDYKPDKFKSLMTENKANIEDYFLWLDDQIKNEIGLNSMRMEYLKLDCKSDIRMFKTWVNSLTYKLNMEWIKSQDDFNQNELRSFTIMFYLVYYDRINESMKDVLSELVLSYPKRAIVKKLTV